jgi:excinuclease ABC subunit C
LKGLNRQSFLYEREAYDISKDQAIQGLVDILGLEKNPSIIEGYDISHMQGTDNVASMVVFKNGLPDKASYRKFKMHLPGNNDFAHINEVITRRLSEKNQKSWGLPDLFLIDGGKGQLSSAIEARDKLGVKRPMIGLAKREEEVVVSVSGSMVNPNEKFLNDHHAFIKNSDDFMTILLPSNSDIVKLLQRIRDESHRFAVSYHSVLKTKRQSSSALDDVPGIGRQTKNKILREFGSKTGAIAASYEDLAKVVGKSKADNIKKYLS